MAIPFVEAGEIERLLPMSDAIDVLERMFCSATPPEAPRRQHHATGHGDLLVMPAWDARGIGIKLVTVTPGNRERGLPLINGIYVLFAAPTGDPVLLVDAAALTGLRTAAVSGVATRHLSRENSSHLVVFGSGVQARAHIEAMRAVRPIQAVTIVGRSRSGAERLAAETGGEVGDPDAVTDADVICTCTTATEPLFDGSRVGAGTHVNAIGSYRPDARELDDLLIARSRVVVDTSIALAESGDLVKPIAAGVIVADAVMELSHAIGITRSPDEVTVFKSVGIASEDLAVASALFERLDV